MKFAAASFLLLTLALVEAQAPSPDTSAVMAVRTQRV